MKRKNTIINKGLLFTTVTMTCISPAVYVVEKLVENIQFSNNSAEVEQSNYQNCGNATICNQIICDNESSCGF